jgi:hypothetical protein
MQRYGKGFYAINEWGAGGWRLLLTSASIHSLLLTSACIHSLLLPSCSIKERRRNSWTHPDPDPNPNPNPNPYPYPYHNPNPNPNTGPDYGLNPSRIPYNITSIASHHNRAIRQFITAAFMMVNGGSVGVHLTCIQCYGDAVLTFLYAFSCSQSRISSPAVARGELLESTRVCWEVEVRTYVMLYLY